jgi:hypothetical protein
MDPYARVQLHILLCIELALVLALEDPDELVYARLRAIQG